MSNSQEITLGEVYRRLTDMDDRHGEALNRIDGHLGSLNSKVAVHERLHAEGNIRLKNVEREIFGAKQEREESAAKSSRDGIVVTVPTDGKTIAALLLALAALLAAVAKAWGA